MGRRKLEMKLIPKKEARMLTFNKRKEGLKKKLDELKTLCDVDACIIIYGPNQAAVPEIYPDDLFQACRLIQGYKAKRGDPSKCKTFGLPDYFKERQEKAEEELTRLKNATREAKYPTWPAKFDKETDPIVLRDFAQKLSAKSRFLKSRIQRMKELDNNNNNLELDRFYQYPPPNSSDVASSSSTNLQQFNSPPGNEMVIYNQRGGAAAALPYYVNLGDNGSDYYWMPPQHHVNFTMTNLNNEYGGGDYVLPALPQQYVDLPMENVNQCEIEGEPYVMENEEGSEYLLPFDY